MVTLVPSSNLIKYMLYFSKQKGNADDGVTNFLDCEDFLTQTYQEIPLPVIDWLIGSILKTVHQPREQDMDCYYLHLFIFLSMFTLTTIFIVIGRMKAILSTMGIKHVTETFLKLYIHIYMANYLITGIFCFKWRLMIADLKREDFHLIGIRVDVALVI